MKLKVPLDLETLIKKRLSSGAYTDAECGFGAPLKLRTPKKVGLTPNATRCRSHIEEGYSPGRAWRTDRRRTGSPGNSGDERRLAFA